VDLDWEVIRFPPRIEDEEDWKKPFDDPIP
jgi:hypothetical protein